MKKLILFLMLLSTTVYGQVLSVDKPEMEEQRRFYEQHLTQKIEKTVESLVGENAYIINVSVRLKRLEVESFSLKNDRFAATQAKLNVQKEFKGEEGLLPLSKLGVWTLPEAPKNEPGSQSYSQRIRNFSELIQSIRVDLFLDEDRVDQPKVRVIRQVVNQLLTGRLPVDPGITVRAMKLGTIAKEKENMKKELLSEVRGEVDRLKRDIEKDRQPASLEADGTFEKIKDFKEVISTLIATLAFFLMGLFISQKYVGVQEKRLQMEESIAMRHSASESLQTKEGVSQDREGFVLQTGEPLEGGQSGIERLKAMIESQPEDAALMIRQWLYMEDREMHAVLASIPGAIPFQLLTKTLELLGETDRKAWNRINSLSDLKISRAQIEYLLNQKISNHLIEPETEIDSDIKDYIAGMTPQEAVACIKSHIETGALLALTMPSLQYTKVLSLLDPITIKQIAVSSGRMDRQKLQTTALKVQAILKEIRRKAEAQTSAFMEKVPEFIRDLGVSKERAIFESVAELGQMEYLIEISRSFFPAELISRLPDYILKAGLDSMDLKERAEFIASQPQMRDSLLESIGSGKMKEILMVEIDEISLDQDRLLVVRRSAQTQLQKFVNRLRSIIQKSEDVQDEVMPLVRQWAQRLSQSGGASAA